MEHKESTNRGGGKVSVSNLVDKIKKKEYQLLSRYLHRSISCLSQRDKAEIAVGIVVRLWNTWRAQTETEGRCQCPI